jgi:hypothetical protein
MSQNIASKLAAVAFAVVMNGVILGGVCYLFASHSYAAQTSAQCQYDATRLSLAIA